MTVLGHDVNQLIDCSDVVPTPPAPASSTTTSLIPRTQLQTSLPMDSGSTTGGGLGAHEAAKRDPAPLDALEGAGAAESRVTTAGVRTGADLDAAHDVADEGVAQAAGEDLESGRGECVLLGADVEGG